MAKIHSFLQETGCRQPIVFNILILTLCDLENEVIVTNIKSGLDCVLTIYLCKFGQNSSIHSEGWVQKSHFQHSNTSCEIDMGSRSPKLNQIFPLPVMKLYKFGQNPCIHLGDRVQKRVSTLKTNMTPAPMVGRHKPCMIEYFLNKISRV